MKTLLVSLFALTIAACGAVQDDALSEKSSGIDSSEGINALLAPVPDLVDDEGVVDPRIAVRCLNGTDLSCNGKKCVGHDAYQTRDGTYVNGYCGCESGDKYKTCDDDAAARFDGF